MKSGSRGSLCQGLKLPRALWGSVPLRGALLRGEGIPCSTSLVGGLGGANFFTLHFHQEAF